MKSYVTKQGDTWDSIAYAHMGDCSYINALMRKNRAYLGFYIFPAGIALNIPEPEISVSENLPPWTQVAG